MSGTGIGLGNGPSKLVTAVARTSVNTTIRNVARMTLPSILSLQSAFRLPLNKKAYRTGVKIT
jgi:hypothetical protein